MNQSPWNFVSYMMSSNKKTILGIVLFLLTVAVFSQSQESRIQLALQNYVTKETLGELEGEGEMLDGVKHGLWIYYLIYDRDIMYCKGNYDNGKKKGVWNNYALIPPVGYANNYDFVRSTETWDGGLLYRIKMGQNNLLILIEEGLGEPYVSEIRRLDEAFENSFRRTHGSTQGPEFGESLESLQSRVVPMLRIELLKSKKKAELKHFTIDRKLKLHELYDSGHIVFRLSQTWDNGILYSKEIYLNEVLSEKYLFMDGDPKDVIHYKYFSSGDLEYMRHYKNDTIPVGRWIENYPGGEKKSQGSYVNGVKSGKWKFWDEDGNVEVVKY